MATKKKQQKKQAPEEKKSAKSTPKSKAKNPPKKSPAQLSKKSAKNPAREPRRPAAESSNEAAPMIKGRGSRTAGQSGDTEGLSDAETVDSESVEELVEEGQDFEAELVDAVTNAPDPDEGELDAEVPAEDDEDPDVRSFSKRNRL
jgi:hypothetical protein